MCAWAVFIRDLMKHTEVAVYAPDFSATVQNMREEAVSLDRADSLAHVGSVACSRMLLACGLVGTWRGCAPSPTVAVLGWATCSGQ